MGAPGTCATDATGVSQQQVAGTPSTNKIKAINHSPLQPSSFPCLSPPSACQSIIGAIAANAYAVCDRWPWGRGAALLRPPAQKVPGGHATVNQELVGALEKVQERYSTLLQKLQSERARFRQLERDNEAHKLSTAKANKAAEEAQEYMRAAQKTSLDAQVKLDRKRRHLEDTKKELDLLKAKEKTLQESGESPEGSVANTEAPIPLNSGTAERQSV